VQLFTTFCAKLSGNPMNKLVMKNLRQEEEEIIDIISTIIIRALQKQLETTIVS
jgi:hypothetical protein